VSYYPMKPTSTLYLLPTGCLSYVRDINMPQVPTVFYLDFLISMSMLFAQNLISSIVHEALLSLLVYTYAYLKHYLFALVYIYILSKRRNFLLLSEMCLLFLCTWYQWQMIPAYGQNTELKIKKLMALCSGLVNRLHGHLKAQAQRVGVAVHKSFASSYVSWCHLKVLCSSI
jgi:hypothetical protein